jgi:hypothetical protein
MSHSISPEPPKRPGTAAIQRLVRLKVIYMIASFFIFLAVAIGPFLSERNPIFPWVLGLAFVAGSVAVGSTLMFLLSSSRDDVEDPRKRPK